MQAVDYAEIANDLEQLAVGGEGVVYRIRSRPALVFKEYKEAQRPTLNVAAFVSLLESVSNAPAHDRQRIEDRTVWPRHLVIRGGKVQGFLMPMVEQAFYRRYGLRANPRVVLCDWNQLIYHHAGDVLPPHMLSEIPQATAADRMKLVRDLAHTMEVLHRSNLVVGDMSGKNLLWALGPPRVVFIDCDSFRLADSVGVCAHKESPGWVDPTLQGSPTNQSSDIYKLGVATYRALVRDPISVVTPDSIRRNDLSTVPTDIVDVISASVGPPADRPTATEWTHVLDDAERFNGRPRIKAPNTSPHGLPRPRPGLPLSPKGGTT